MKQLKGACIIGQSGYPTSVINASTLGTIQTALHSNCITKVYGAANGIRGLLEDKLYDLNLEDENELLLLRFTPSSALGSCRYKIKDPDVDDTDFKRLLEIFKKYNIRYFFYNGGNDSMDSCNKISRYMQKVGYECRIIGIPKSIDNNLFGTDHCPGYGSAAKYIATSCMEIYQDAHIYDFGMITVLEISGKSSGWLTASTALATAKGYGPDLIYLPEIAFDINKFLTDISRIYKEKGNAIVAVSEGIKNSNGKYISEHLSDMTFADNTSTHAKIGGLSSKLSAIIKEKTGAKARGIELSFLPRCAAHCASKADCDESYMAGKAAVESAITGITDKMVGFECTRDGGYKCKIKLLPLDIVANTEKIIPREWINDEGNGLNQAFVDYILPLISGEPEFPTEDGLPRFAQLKKILAK